MNNLLPFLGVILISNLAYSFDWQGHRGARGLYPENTIAAMKKGLQFPITTLEMDVVISKDNQVVVSHDAWMSEEICLTKDGKPVKEKEFALYQMSYVEIKKFDCGSKTHPRFLKQEKKKEIKPLLSDLLGEMEKSGKHSYSIEIKSTKEEEELSLQPQFKQFTDLVVKSIMKKVKLEQVTLQSFDWRVINYIHDKYPNIKTVALIEVPYDFQNVLKEFKKNPTVFSPDYKMLTKEQVDFFHSKQIKVIPWTVNEIAPMKELKTMGVDGIITDYPNLIQEVEQEKILK
ncbi:MAG: glycerophosphodiester phosphodiesterase family protein [Bacteriovoracaceae bacterium]